MTINLVLIVLICTTVWELGTFSQTLDTEVWNGAILGKNREKGHYRESYECNCHNVCSGSGKDRTCHEKCSTCYTDHYTVTWSASTSVGDIRFDHVDSTSRSVYDTPDPAVFKQCIKGEPASLEHLYRNYVQAVPQSLYGKGLAESERYAAKIPTYPQVHNFYRINRVLNVDSKISRRDIDRVNLDLNGALRKLGAQKEVNIVVILTEIDEPAYRYAVEHAWLGGEMNDVVVFVGLNGTDITWTDVMTWALNKGNEYFHTTLRSELGNMKTFDPKTFSPLVLNSITRYYDRPKMEEFVYLKDEVEPPLWVVILAIIIATVGSLSLSFYFHTHEVDDFIINIFRGNTSWNRRNRL